MANNYGYNAYYKVPVFPSAVIELYEIWQVVVCILNVIFHAIPNVINLSFMKYEFRVTI